MATGALSLRRYAIQLGVVYRRLHQLGYLPLDTWAVPAPAEPIGWQLRIGLETIYWDDLNPYQDQYRIAYDAVMPTLEREANAEAQAILTNERNSLLLLLHRLRLPGTADRIHEVTGRIGRRAGGYGPSQDDVNQAGAETGGIPRGWAREDPHIRAFGKAITAKIRARVTVAVRAEVTELTAERSTLDPRGTARRKALAEMVVVLFNHPRGVEILATYDRSPVTGLELASELIAEATTAIDEFAGDLQKQPKDVWRYPPLVCAGITRMGLNDVNGFPEYAVDAGQVLGRSKAETAANHLGMVLFCVGIVFTGPVGAVVVGVADLALTSAGGVLAYLREREQNMAASASAFRAAGAKIGDPNDYEDTMMAAAAALVSAISLLGEAKQLLKAKPRKPGTPPARANLKLDTSDHGAGFLPKHETAIQRSGDNAVLTKKEMLDNARATNRSQRIGPPSDQLSPQKITANKKRLDAADAARLGPGAPRELAPEALDAARGTAARTRPPEFDPLDYNTVPSDELARETTATAPAGQHASRTDLLDEATMTARQQQAAEPHLDKIPRANNPGKPPRRVITREEQLHGINLEWDKTIRKRTPSDEIQEWARRQLSPGDLDPLIPTLRVDKATADHIVPVELIKQFPGFAELDVQTQIKILNTPENFMPVSKQVNEARNSRPFSQWSGLPDHPIPPNKLKEMQNREKQLATLLQQRINDALRTQQEARGVLRGLPPAPGARVILPPAPGSLIRQTAQAENEPANR